MPRKRADEVQPGEYIRVGDSIQRIGRVEPGMTLATVELLIGEGGCGYYEFPNERIVEVGFARTETGLSFDLSPMRGLNFTSPADAQEYIEKAVSVNGDHVRGRFRIQTREVLTFTTEWADI